VVVLCNPHTVEGANGSPWVVVVASVRMCCAVRRVQNLHGGSFWFPPQDPNDLNPT
jgi:hypothetical protein